MIGLLTLFAAAKPVLFDTLDPDCFWHLRVAEQLQREGIGPIVDGLSFNSLKTPWTPYSWLAELGMNAIWQVGGFRAAIATQAMLQGAFVVLLALCGRTRRRDNPLAIIVAVTVTLFLSMPYLSFRPVTLAIDLLALIAWLILRDDCGPASLSLYAVRGQGSGIFRFRAAPRPKTPLPAYREREKASRFAVIRSIGWGISTRYAIWFIVPLTALLANVHFFALLVPLIFAARVMGDWIERVRIKRDALLLILTTLACCATPMLPGMLASVWHYQFADSAVAARLAAEFTPIYAGNFGKLTLALLIIWLIAMLRSDLRMGEKIWAAGFAVLLLRMGRFAPLFAPIGVATIAHLLPRFSGRVLERKSLRLAMVCILALGTGRIVMSFPTSEVPLSAWLNRHGPDTPGYPTGAADYVAARIPAGPLLNDFSWGGYLEWRLGSAHPVLIDGRTQLFAPAVWNKVAADDYGDVVSLPATAAIVPAAGDALRRALIDAGWNVAFKDERAQVLTPPGFVRAD